MTEKKKNEEEKKMSEPKEVDQYRTSKHKDDKIIQYL